MPEDVLHFSCQACRTKLTVPAKLAGVEGPCPKCGATIRAPQLDSPAPAPAATTPPMETAAPATAPPLPESTAGFRKPETLPERRDPPPQATEQASIRPQPRELPDRPPRPAVSPRHSTSDVAKRPPPRAERSPGSSGSRAAIGRFLIPVAFLFIGGALAYVLLYFFMDGRGKHTTKADAPPPVVDPADPAPPPEHGGTPDPANAASDPADPPPPPPSDVPDPADGLEAQDVLRDFLRASSIGARLPLIEPSYEREDLEGSVVDTPLLSADRIMPDAPVRNTREGFVDHPFRVTFERDDNSKETILVVVRKRNDQKAKVLIDPLLDLLGGRLEAFTSEPSGESATFRAVIEAMPRCFEKGIPNPDDKITYKISSSTHGGEVVRAYASKLSPLAEMLYSPDSALRWGKRLPATITLKWNTEEAPATEEHPGQPYLELIESQSLDWSP